MSVWRAYSQPELPRAHRWVRLLRRQIYLKSYCFRYWSTHSADLVVWPSRHIASARAVGWGSDFPFSGLGRLVEEIRAIKTFNIRFNCNKSNCSPSVIWTRPSPIVLPSFENLWINEDIVLTTYSVSFPIDVRQREADWRDNNNFRCSGVFYNALPSLYIEVHISIVARIGSVRPRNGLGRV